MYLNLLGKQWCCDEFIEFFREVAAEREIYVVTSDNPKITEPTFREKRVREVVISCPPYDGRYFVDKYISPSEMVFAKMRLQNALDSPSMEDVPQQTRVFNAIQEEFGVKEYYSIENSLMLKLNDMTQLQKRQLLGFLSNFDDNSPEVLITIDLNQAPKAQLDLVELWLDISRASNVDEDDNDIADDSNPLDFNLNDDEEPQL
ncbi:MAG: hypothetical protein GX801_08660 [Fibrobacter sp.]|nr:hypothetical protein [Fibrobacter sp.]